MVSFTYSAYFGVPVADIGLRFYRYCFQQDRC